MATQADQATTFPALSTLHQNLPSVVASHGRGAAAHQSSRRRCASTPTPERNTQLWGMYVQCPVASTEREIPLSFVNAIQGKRRKIRCFFERPSSQVCVGCQRRGTACIGQEFIDVPSEADAGAADSHTAERLRRVEHMLEMIAGKVLPDTDSLDAQASGVDGGSSSSRLGQPSDGEHTDPGSDHLSQPEDGPGRTSSDVSRSP